MWLTPNPASGLLHFTINDPSYGLTHLMADFQEFQAAPRIESIRRSKRDLAVTSARRIFLPAYACSTWGLDAKAMIYSELARWLTDGGFLTSKEVVENAKRPSAKLVEHVVVRNGAVDHSVAFVQAEFPSFRGHRLCAP